MEAIQTAPTVGRRDRKRTELRDRLAAIAFDLFEQQGFEAVSMEQIAAKADVARGTLYNHFPVKEALLDHYFRQEWDGGIRTVITEIGATSGIEARLIELFGVFASWAERRRLYLPFLLAFGLERDLWRQAKGLRDGLDEVFSSLIHGAQGEGELPPGVETSVLVTYLKHLYLAATLRWLASEASSPQGEFRRMIAFFLAGARAMGTTTTETNE